MTTRMDPDWADKLQSTTMLRQYYKLQTACAQLYESIKLINECSLSSAQVVHMLSSGNQLEKAIATSPTISITSRLKETESDFNISQLFEEYKFEEGAPAIDDLVRYPIISDAQLEELAFLHRSCTSMNVHATQVEKASATNERLEFLGDSWLGAFVSYILYKKYPYADEGALSKMRSAIVNNVNLAKWCERVGFNERLQDNIPRTVHKIKDMAFKHYADCFEAYVGALVIDKYSVEFSEVVRWIENLAGEIFDNLGPQMVKAPVNKNAKHELSALLVGNKVGTKLAYHRLNSSSPFKVEVKLGDISLATAEGSSIREAEQCAAMNAILDTANIKRYSNYKLEDERQIEKASTEKTGNRLVTNTKQTKVNVEIEKEPISSKLQSNEEAVDVPLIEPMEQNNGISVAHVSDIVEQVCERCKTIGKTAVSEATMEAMVNKSFIDQRQIVKRLSSSYFTKDEVTVDYRGLYDYRETLEHDDKTTLKASLHGASQNLPVNAISTHFTPATALSTQAAQAENTALSQTALDPPLTPLAEMQSTPVEAPHVRNSGTAVSHTSLFEDRLSTATAQGREISPKQEFYSFLGKRGFRPYYQTTMVGLNTFSCICMLQGFNVFLGQGHGPSKRFAEHEAAFHSMRNEALIHILENPSAYSTNNSS